MHYTAPGTLLTRKTPDPTEVQEDYYEEVANDEDQRVIEKLLDATIVVEDERL